MKLLLFCVESNNKEQIDWIYIESIIRNMFAEDRNVTIRPLFMNGRSNYNSLKVRRCIERFQTMSYESVKVIYCVDTDRIEVNASQKKEFEGIVDYCNEKNYELIWFCHDIEEVFLGHSVSDSEKRACATKFIVNSGYRTLDIKKLMKTDYHAGWSNIITVIGNHLSLLSN